MTPSAISGRNIPNPARADRQRAADAGARQDR